MIATRKICSARANALRCAAAIAATFVLLAGIQAAVAGSTVVRDHRGQDATTSLKPLWWGHGPVRPRRDPGWANYGNGKGGPTVRDHRH